MNSPELLTIYQQYLSNLKAEAGIDWKSETNANTFGIIFRGKAYGKMILNRITQRDSKDATPHRPISSIQFVNNDNETFVPDSISGGINLFKSKAFDYSREFNLDVIYEILDKSNEGGNPYYDHAERINYKDILDLWDVFFLLHELGHAFDPIKDNKLSNSKYIIAKIKLRLLELPEADRQNYLNNIRTDSKSEKYINTLLEPHSNQILLHKDEVDLILEAEHFAWQFAFAEIQKIFRFLGIDYLKVKKIFESHAEYSLMSYRSLISRLPLDFDSEKDFVSKTVFIDQTELIRY
jgi:hypothetical protein